jgi:hypothetical protein
MIKTTFAAVALIAALGIPSAFGQGTIVFGNTTTTKISTNSVVGGAATGLTSATTTAGGSENFYFALFYSTSQTSVSGSTAAVLGTNGVYAFNASGWVNGSQSSLSTNGVAAGRFQPSSPNSDGSASVSALTGGTSADFVVIGWSANIGSTVAALQAWLANPTSAGWVGESAVSGTLTPGTLGSTGASGLFGTATGLIPGWTLGLVSVPEPGTLALAAIGGASLLLFRRKK